MPTYRGPAGWRKDAETEITPRPASNLIGLEADLSFQDAAANLTFPEDAGARTLADFPVSASPAAGTEESYSFDVDGTTILTIYAEADGAGGLQNTRTDIPVDLTVTGSTTEVDNVVTGKITVEDGVPTTQFLLDATVSPPFFDLNSNEVRNASTIQVPGGGGTSLNFTDPDDDSDILIVHEGGPVEVATGDLRIPTGSAIEDGSGTERINFTSALTLIKDDDGNIAFEADSARENRVYAYSDTTAEFWDAQGTFAGVSYSTSASAPGTLELDANTFIKDGAGLVVGDTSTFNSAGNTPQNQTLGTGPEDSTALLARFSNDSFDATFKFYKGRGGSLGTRSAVSSGDALGAIEWYGEDDDGNNAQLATDINSVVDGSVSAATVPTRLEISTTTSGGTLTEALRIDSSQDVIVQNGDLLLQDGSESDPALAFDSDEDTGLFLDGSGTLRLVTAGSNALSVNASQATTLAGHLLLGGNTLRDVGGTTDASTGAIRMANGVNINASNNAGDANLLLLGSESDDDILLGNGNATRVFINSTEFHATNGVIITNGSGTALPGTSTDGEIRVFDDTDATDPGGVIQFRANSTTFTVPAMAEGSVSGWALNQSLDMAANVISAQGRLGADPTLTDDTFRFYQSDGSGTVTGDEAGDVVVATDAGGTEKTAVLFDFGTGSVSSARYKEDIQAASAGPVDPEAVLDLTVSTYRDRDSGERGLGFIAEEVYAAFDYQDGAVDFAPVSEDRWTPEYGDTWGYEPGEKAPNQVNDTWVLAATVKTVQDHDKRLAQKERRIEELETRLQALESEVAS